MRIARNLLLCLLVFWALFYVFDQFSIELLPATEAEEQTETFYETTWQCDYCEGTRDGDADVKIGANAKTKSKTGETALDYAKENEKIYKTKAYWELKDAFHSQD